MDYGEAASYWEKKDRDSAHMERGELLAEAERFILAHNICALATAYGGLVRCTPIEYAYRGGRFWLLSEGGVKFSALAENKNVCLAIYEPYAGFEKLSGMQITGKAEIVEPRTAAYTEYLRFKNIPEKALHALDHPMYLIEITPERIDFLCSDFKKRGSSVRQHIEF